MKYFLISTTHVNFQNVLVWYKDDTFIGVKRCNDPFGYYPKWSTQEIKDNGFKCNPATKLHIIFYV